MDGTATHGFSFAIFDRLDDPVIVTDTRFQGSGPAVLYSNAAFA